MFECDCCGLCCMHIDESGLDEGLNRGDGVCKYFDEKTHLCRIYRERPLICSVDRFYEAYLSSKITREDFYRTNYLSCKKIKERYGEKNVFSIVK